MSNNKFTAADYRAIAEKRRAAQKTFIIKCRSGAEFTAIVPDLNMYFASGKLPEFQQNQMAILKAQENGDFAAQIAYDPELQAKIINASIFLRNLVLRFVISPRIVENPKSDDEIGFDELSMDDFKDLSDALQKGGGDGAQVAETFREKG